MMVGYLEELWELQNLDEAYMNKILEKKYPSKNKKAALVDFEIMYFDTKDDLFAWTSADNYTYTDGNAGVCYGFQISNDANAWNLELYFND